MDIQDASSLSAMSLQYNHDSFPFLDLPAPAMSAVAKHLPTTQCLQLGRELLARKPRAAAAVLSSIRRLGLQVPHGAPVRQLRLLTTVAGQETNSFAQSQDIQGALTTLTRHLQNLQELVLEPLPVNPHQHHPQTYRKACQLLGLTDSETAFADYYEMDYDAYNRDDSMLCTSLAQLTQLTGLTLLLPFGTEVDTVNGFVWTQNRLPRKSVSQVCQALGHLTNLRSLAARYLNPSDSDMEHLSSLINLEYLDISTHGAFCGPASPAINILDPPLCFPTAPDSSLHPSGATPIACLTNLQCLDVSGHRELGTNGISQLSGLTSLTSLNINNTHCGSDAMVALEPVLRNLVELLAAKVCQSLVDDQAVGEALARGLNAERLSLLDLSNDDTSYYIIPAIASLSKLKELRLHPAFFTETRAHQQLQELSAVLQNLTALSIAETRGAFPACTPIIMQLTMLKRLQLPSMHLGAADLAVVCQALTNLTASDLMNNAQAVTTDSCKHISCLQQLQWLGLQCCVPGMREFSISQGVALSSVLADQLVSLPRLGHLMLQGCTAASMQTGGLEWEILFPALARISSLKELRLASPTEQLGCKPDITFSLLLHLTQLRVLEVNCMGPCSMDDFSFVLDVALLRSTLTNLTELHFLGV